ncbi:MAG: secretin and TonB N-terminal domain-containing protein [Calditrichia bacterium]
MELLRMLILLMMMAVTCIQAQPGLQETLNRKISAHFQNTSLPDVLRLLARQNGLNLVVGSTVNGAVTIQLTDVSLADALNAILKSHGYHYVVQNEILLVKPFELEVNGELETRIFKLNYLDGFQLETTVAPLLSSKGKIQPLISENEKDEILRRSDILVVTDVWENLNKMEKLIAGMDTEPLQLQIEVKLVERLVGNNTQVGFNWPTKVGTSLTGGEVTAPITKSNSAQQQQRYLSAWYELPSINDDVTWGVLTVDELRATLELLAQDNSSRLVSNPKITTVNNKKATIDVGTTIPVPEVSRGISGDLISYKEKQVSMFVEVIPRVNDDQVIQLSVHPRLEEIIGYTGTSDFPQPITSRREVKTQVSVRPGETLAIGGLLKESENKIVEKIWLLGDIPLLGYLFRHTTTKKEKSDLLIFITPTIISANSEG